MLKVSELETSTESTGLLLHVYPAIERMLYRMVPNLDLQAKCEGALPSLQLTMRSTLGSLIRVKILQRSASLNAMLLQLCK